ncbi:putative Zn-dependent peptidase [Nakamurella sp. UYEF19]|uniref:M16 family metallopeptidase n=1 Tax=Nakamurella sp. UYEF19 TaxID=1756392 RepID=UPI003392DEF6
MTTALEIPPKPAPAPPALIRYTLSNGLRVLLLPDPRISRVAVCMHYGVGFRSEQPGQEGLAHLFEHLMFRGSRHLPDGRFYDHVHALGGTANGTTHQDYTDFYQVVPAVGLDLALFAEADRMAAPRFTRRGVAEQLIGVGQEIASAIGDRPYGGVPWPLLPGLLFSRFANSHDGYGSPSRLMQTTVEDCEEFFLTHYAPGNAVLTVAGGFDPQDAIALVDRHFGSIASRSKSHAPDLSEPIRSSAAGPTAAESGDALVPHPLAVLGIALAGAETDPGAMAAQLVLAALLTRNPPTGLGPLDAGCGLLGPLDARSPDALVVVAALPDGWTGERLADTLRGWWGRAIRQHETDIAAARNHVLTGFRRAQADLVTSARARGRGELLGGGAESVDNVIAQLAVVDAVSLDRAAATLLGRAPAVVTVRNRGPRAPWLLSAHPVVTPGPLPDGTDGGPTFDTGGAAVGPALLARRSPRGPEIPVARSVELPGGGRLLILSGTAGPMEIAVRGSVAAAGRRNPSALYGWVADLHREVDAFGRRTGGGSSITTDGQWWQLRSFLAPEHLNAWTAVLDRLLARLPIGAAPTESTRSVPPDGDALLRLRWTDDGVPGPLLDLAGLVVVVAGSNDIGGLEQSLVHGLRDTRPVETSNVTGLPAPTRLLVPGGERDWGTLTISVPDPTPRMHDPARYLATAVAGGYRQARLALRSTNGPGVAYQVFAGYDRLGDHWRSFVRACAPTARLEDVEHEVLTVIDDLASHPPTAQEIEPARLYCAGQIESATDSPASMVALLAHLMATGSSAAELESYPDRLQRIGSAEVAAVAAGLFAGPRTTVVTTAVP